VEGCVSVREANRGGQRGREWRVGRQAQAVRGAQNCGWAGGLAEFGREAGMVNGWTGRRADGKAGNQAGGQQEGRQ
jgi:hypothetical protein